MQFIWEPTDVIAGRVISWSGEPMMIGYLALMPACKARDLHDAARAAVVRAKAIAAKKKKAVDHTIAGLADLLEAGPEPDHITARPNRWALISLLDGRVIPALHDELPVKPKGETKADSDAYRLACKRAMAEMLARNNCVPSEMFSRASRLDAPGAVTEVRGERFGRLETEGDWQ